MKHHIHTYGDPVLRRKTDPVGTIDESIRRLADDMMDAMTEACGVGLAAPQIGRSVRMCVVNIPPEHDMTGSGGERLNPHLAMPLFLINPEIVERSGSQSGDEACLSIPQATGQVTRAFEISVTFMNLNGEEQRLNMKGFLARAIQHEIDHLDGRLFVDRVSPAKRIALGWKLKRMRAQTGAD